MPVNHIGCLFAFTVAVATNPQPAITFVLPVDLPFDEQILALHVQGLANREDALVWFIEPVFWTNNASTAWFQAYFQDAGLFTFKNASSLCEVLAALPLQTVTGLVLYDAEKLDASRWLAVTTGALHGWLPVTSVILAQPEYACLSAWPVRANYANITFASNVDAYAWALDKLFPAGCDTGAAYSAGHSYTDASESVFIGGDPAIDIGIDIAVAKKFFVFNLSPDSVRYPAHAAQWGSVVGVLAGVPSVYGWAEPEPAMTASTSKAGGAVVCTAAPNLSFWTHVAAASPALPYHRSGAVFDPTASYITWQTNEGDTPKILASLMQAQWLDSRRGSIPIAWGVDPMVLDVAPGLLDFYASTATVNDTWFAATAGAGYAYPWMMPDMAPYVTRAASLIERLLPNWPANSFEVDIWDNNNLTALAAYKALAGDAVGMFSMQPEELPGTNSWLPDGTPVVITTEGLWYPSLNASDPYGDMQARISAVLDAHPPPFFLVVYGQLLDNLGHGIFDYALEMQRRFAVGARRVHVVGMQDHVAFAREAHTLRAVLKVHN